MNRANRLNPLMAVFFCAAVAFGCGDNNDPSEKKNVNTADPSPAAQGKLVRTDGYASALSPTRLKPTFKGTERSDKLREEEGQKTQLLDADKKIYPARAEKAEPQPLDPTAISSIQTQSERYYQSVNASERIQALEEIGKISGDSSVSINTFIDALSDPDTQVRVEAVNQLANSNQEEEALGGMVAALNDANPGVVIAALNNLAFMDDPALAERISPLLASPNAQVSAAAAQAIEFLRQ